MKIYSGYYDLNISYLGQIKKYKTMIFSSLRHLFLQLTTDPSLKHTGIQFFDLTYSIYLNANYINTISN